MIESSQNIKKILSVSKGNKNREKEMLELVDKTIYIISFSTA
jgi:hypothetical protein